MNRGLYLKLAAQNIRTNKNTFFPFSFSCVVMTAMYYLIASLRAQVVCADFLASGTMESVLTFGMVICGVFSFFVIVYTNGFLVKRRSKEFGLYSILGMDKRHIGKVVFWEMALIGAASILLGLFAGVLFSKLLFLLLSSMIGLQAELTFAVAPDVIWGTALLFAGFFLTILLMNAVRVFRLKPLELAGGGRVGEREPKAKWLLAVLGLVCMGVGYYLALTVQNPIDAMSIFFLAVLFVIAGTYLLFVSGSIALLKCLKKSKRYFYHKNHFITVSGLMYRMKQNAVGLANICVLCTAALVAISTTVSLYVGMEDILRTRYPYDVMADWLYADDGTDFDSSFPTLAAAVEQSAAEHHVSVLEEESYYSYTATGYVEDDVFLTDWIDTLTELQIVRLEDHQKLTGDETELLPGEVLVYAGGSCRLPQDTVTVIDREFTVKGVLSEKQLPENVVHSSYAVLYLVVADLDTMKEIRDSCEAADGYGGSLYYNYNFNLSGTMEDKQAFCADLRDTLNATGVLQLASVSSIFTSRSSFYQLYGSLFFIGIFIGGLFLMTTAMIIYYKQVSEGYDDRERFVILQKVGMSGREVKKTIKNQILLVFFLPILMAVVHICFAFDCIKKILYLFNLSNTAIFAAGTAGTIVVFFIGYTVIYRLTAKVYYRIVNFF